MMQKTRISPPPDKRTVCVYDEIPILSFYAEAFESVFVSLNPFLRIKQSASFDHNDFRGKLATKQATLENTDAVTWKEVVKISELADFSAVDIALRTGILGLKQEFENKKFAETLDKAIEAENIIYPGTGSVQEIQEDSILKAIKSLGYEWIWLGTQFGDKMELVWIDDIIESVISIGNRNLFTHDRKILVTAHWDSFQTYICSSKTTVAEIARLAELEGFYCSPKTEIYWSIRGI